MRIIETHCHLDYLKDLPIEEILQKSTQVGVEKVITIAVEPANLDQAMQIAHTWPQVYFTQGIHPHDAKLATDEALATIRQRCSDPKMVAVGEIGLDYHYDNSPRQVQRDMFAAQLDIAIACNKPVVIHSRDADQETIDMLELKAPTLSRKGVIHSFTSGPELAQKALDLGFYLGFNGIITFKTAEAVRDIVRLCPVERMLVETDAPFLTPVPHRGKENAPYHLPHILQKIAEIKAIPIDQVAQIIFNNSEKLFFS